MMKRFIFSIFLLPLLLASPQTKAQGIMLTPKWTAQAQFTGYYVADKLGFYKEEGIDVCVQHPAISESSFFVYGERSCPGSNHEPFIRIHGAACRRTCSKRHADLTGKQSDAYQPLSS